MSRVDFNPSITKAPLTPLKESFYQFSSKFLSADKLAKDYFDKRLNRMGSGNVLKPLVGFAKEFFTNLGKQDFKGFKTAFGIPTRFAIPPLGGLMVMMYIGLAYARAKRGYDRGLLPNGQRDKREMWDAIRRDFYSITLYIFGLQYADKFFSQLSEKAVGYKIFDGASREPYTFAALKTNSRLENAKVLAAHIKNGHGEGLLKAAQNGGYFGIPDTLKKEDPALAKQMGQLILRFRSTLKSLAKLDPKALEKGKHATTLNSLSHNAMTVLTRMDGLRGQFVESQAAKLAKQSGSVAQHARELAKLVPEYKDFFVKYTRNNRSPIGLYSLLTILVSIGYGPIWFNKWWTERQYQKLQAERKKQSQTQHLSHNKPKVILHKAQAQTGLHPLSTYPSLAYAPSPLPLTNVNAWALPPQNLAQNRFYTNG